MHSNDKSDPYEASSYNCPKCGVPFLYHSHRNWLLKKFFPNYPVRRFYCGNCYQKYYVKVRSRADQD